MTIFLLTALAAGLVAAAIFIREALIIRRTKPISHETHVAMLETWKRGGDWRKVLDEREK